MPKNNNDEELKVKEQQNESLADSKKIDLYINNNGDEPKSISILNVFSRLKQRFRIYVWAMLIALLAGLLVPTMMYTFKDKKESAVAILGLDYAGADAEKAPDGSRLDITYLKSSYIIQNALNSVTLSKQVSTAQVQSSLTITGILTDETRQKMEIITKLEEVKNTDYSKVLAEFSKQYRAQYIVSLGNPLTEGKNKVKLSSTDLSHLLSAITIAYNDYFVETYQDIELPVNTVDAINVEFLDYLDILDKASASLNNLKVYCDNRAGLMPGFRATNGLSFSDLSDMIGTLRSANINNLYSYIYLNNVCKDRDILVSSYQSRRLAIDSQLDVINANIAAVETEMAKPENQQQTVNVDTTQSGGTSQQYTIKTEYYNQLVLQRLDLLSQKSALEEELAVIDFRIDKLTNGVEPTPSEIAEVEQVITDILAKTKNLFNIATSSSKELFYSNAYQNKYMHAVTTYESEGLRDNLKLFLLGAGLGLFLGIAIWVVDAFALEFKDVKKANEALENKEAE